MSEDFKEKLQAYAEGRLSEEEKAVMEVELQKLELYQEFIDEQLDIKESWKKSDKSNIVKNADKIIKKGKWKARFQNGFIALILLFLFLMITQILTDKYYNLGNPSKSNIYLSVLSSAIETTSPNAEINGNGFGIGTFFSSNAHVYYSKYIGNQQYGNGDLSVDFIFNKPSKITDINPSGIRGQTYFINPKGKGFNNGYRSNPAWNRLDKLPEATVTEAYITFDKLYETEEVFKKLDNKKIRLLWLAVDTGLDDAPPTIYEVIGFPHNVFQPLLEDRKNATSSTDLALFHNGEKRNENFIKTLEFLIKYKHITNIIAPVGDFKSALEYVNKNGVKIYGVTVTGPTKEILKLKEESFVGDINLGETQFWNWD